MSEHDRDEHGHFRAEHDDREYLEAVAEHEPAGTSEIAETLGVTRQTADRRLRKLAEDGAVASKEIGNSLAWMLPDDAEVVSDVNPDDDFWEVETYAGEEMSAADVDDVLYG